MSVPYLSCYGCEHYFKNDSMHQKHINGKHIKSLDAYCGFYGKGKQMKRIGRRDRPQGRMHPAWCPRYDKAESCMTCGKTLYGDEGITCKSCKRKGL